MSRRALAAIVASIAFLSASTPLGAAPARPANAGGGFEPAPGGAELSVELDVADPGDPGGGTGGGSASPIRVEVVALTSPDGTGAEHLCTPDPNVPGQLGWSYLVITFDAASGSELGREVVCVAVRGGRPEPPSMAVPPTLLELWRAVGVPAPAIATDPATESVVGIDTYLRAISPASIDVAITVRGYSVRGIARLVEHRIDPGDGVARPHPVDAGRSTATHVYETKGVHRLRVIGVWRADVTMTGPGFRGRSTTVDLGRALLRTTTDYRVVEVRSVLLP
ncbi:MAG TPA: hypothetical protein VFZ83_06745 [Acidimicrobiia bacterium]|nr:hypothetical protein [Acidimicrobiia bacterium]